MTKTSLRWGTLALAVATLAGCATTENALKDANTLLEEREIDKLLPVTNLSPYALALGRFGRMLDIYKEGDPVIYMQTRSILDDGEGLRYFASADALFALIDQYLVDATAHTEVVRRGQAVWTARHSAERWTATLLQRLGIAAHSPTR